MSREEFVSMQDALGRAAEEKAARRQHALGKKTARERISGLVDEGSFVEVGRFVGGNVAEGFSGSAVVTGYGRVNGRPVAIYAQDFSVAGGTLGEAEGDKIVSLIRRAVTIKAPIVAMLDSGGARIQDGVVALARYGRIFRAIVDASGIVPQVSVVMGPSAGGAVYGPALTDFVIMTRDTSHMFVTGPEVVRATTGESVDAGDLGGGEVHAGVSGAAHYLAEDEDDALDYTRALLDYLPRHCDDGLDPWEYSPAEAAEDDAAARAVGDLVPESTKQPYDMATVVETLCDHGEFLQVHELFARNILCGFAALGGRTVGIVANQPAVDAGTLDVNTSEKAARFVRFCDAFRIPIVTLVDVPGYLPGTAQERAGIIRRGAKLIWAYAEASTPCVTVILRKAYGGAYIVMGSKSLGGDAVFSWPGAEIAVLGAEGAVAITGRRRLRAAREAGEDVAELRRQLVEQYTAESVNPNLSVARGEVDAVIAPAETRRVLLEALGVLSGKDPGHPAPRRHGNIPL